MIVNTEKIGVLSVWTDQNSMNGKTTVTVLDARPLFSSILANSNMAKVEKLDLDFYF